MANPGFGLSLVVSNRSSPVVEELLTAVLGCDEDHGIVETPSLVLLKHRGGWLALGLSDGV
jgi:hypothetical protein